MTIVVNKALAQRILRRKKNKLKRKLKKIVSVYFLADPFDFEFDFKGEDLE